jgi:predicted transcriptional regulator
VRSIPVSDFASDEFPRVSYDDLALTALERMTASQRDYAMVVEEGDVVGVIEQSQLVFAYGRGELRPESRVSELARDLPCIDPDATFDDVVAFMVDVGIYQVCVDNKVMDDFMLLRAIWTERLAVAKAFREYERPEVEGEA